MRKPRFNPKSPPPKKKKKKKKKKIIKFLSVDDSIYVYLSYGTLVVHDIGSAQGWLTQQSFFVKHVKNVFIQVLRLCAMQCGCMNCCFVVKAPANANMQPKQCQLGQHNFVMFYTIDYCATIHAKYE